jgi:subtilisin family serine protease
MRFVHQAVFLWSALTLAACGGGLDMAPESEELGQSQAPLLQAAPGLAIADEYIVVFKDGVAPQALAAELSVSPRHTYSIINGFAATLNASQLAALRNNPRVAYVEQDAIVERKSTQTSAPWGLDRIDQRALPLNGTYNYTTTASTVTAYIIDTGIQTSHPQFGGRASNVYDAFGGTGNDCNGHGTAVASIVGGSVYGVAKAVRLRGVRVMDCNGSGTISGIIAGMDWVRVNRINPAVANMSLGGGFSSSLNTAANNLANSGVFLSVAAGNSNSDACNYSPASAASATTVGCSTNSDTRCPSSNFGSCVDLYAPGMNIPCSGLNGTVTTLSGTSPASAHVCGTAALYKATYGNAASSTIDSWLKTNGTTLSFGKLLYKNSL